MKNIFIYAMCSFSFMNFLFSGEFYTYEEQTGNKKSYFTWDVEKSNKNTVVYGEEDDASTILYFNDDFKIYKYVYKSKKVASEYEFSLDGSTLLATGKINNLNINKKYVIKTPWVQQFGFGLQPFILSEKKSIEFCLISPKDFALQKMIARKEGKEIISSGEKKYETQKVIITLTGFKSKFWKARLWFDVTNGNLVKYSANKGPSTATTTDMLQSIEQKKGSSEKLKKSPKDEKK